MNNFTKILLIISILFEYSQAYSMLKLAVPLINNFKKLISLNLLDFQNSFYMKKNMSYTKKN